MWKYKLMYLLLLPACIWVFIFDYLPVYGISVAFMDYNFIKGMSGSEWAGLKYFQALFESDMFLTAFKNTLQTAVYLPRFVSCTRSASRPRTPPRC